MWENIVTLAHKILRRVKIEDSTFCWRWKGATAGGEKPYSKIWVGKRNRLVHRVAYEVFRDGMELLLLVL